MKKKINLAFSWTRVPAKVAYKHQPEKYNKETENHQTHVVYLLELKSIRRLPTEALSIATHT